MPFLEWDFCLLAGRGFTYRQQPCRTDHPQTDHPAEQLVSLR